MKDYYKILGLKKDCSQLEVEEAYNILSQKYDPNKHAGDRHIEERFIDIAIAYRTLIDADKRNDYNKILKSLALDSYDRTKTPERKTLRKTAVQRKRIWLTYMVIAIMIAGGIFFSKRSLYQGRGATPDARAKVQLPQPPNTATESSVVIHGRTDTSQLATSIQLTPERYNMTTSTAVQKPKTRQVKKAVSKVTDTTDAYQWPDAQVINTNTSYSIGTTKSAALAIQGTPTAITRIDTRTEILHYGKSKLYFENGRLKSYDNAEGNLLIKK